MHQLLRDRSIFMQKLQEEITAASGNLPALPQVFQGLSDMPKLQIRKEFLSGGDHHSVRLHGFAQDPHHQTQIFPQERHRRFPG